MLLFAVMERPLVSVQTKQEYVQAIYDRYRGARRPEKQRILDEFCAVTKQHRKHAIRLLNGPAPGGARPRRSRDVRYGRATIAALQTIWEAAGYPWSVRLKALLPLWLPWARRRLRLRPAVEQQLLRISPRQIDRRLAPQRRQLRKRLYGRTKPGTRSSTTSPLKTDRWDVSRPRLHGDRSRRPLRQLRRRGVRALAQCDRHPHQLGGDGRRARQEPGRGAEALEELRQALPFRLRGIDSDNGSEFINQHLWDYCQAQELQFTRGRPYKKDDNAHIEQKNWTHVRRLLGYVRYDSPGGAGRDPDPYRGELRLFQNLFLPSVKLPRKERVGARVRRRYDAPQTPLDRVLACAEISEAVAAQLRRQRARLIPSPWPAASSSSSSASMPWPTRVIRPRPLRPTPRPRRRPCGAGSASASVFTPAHPSGAPRAR